jgi:hypothetical protein
MSAEGFDAQNMPTTFLSWREHERNKMADVSRFRLVDFTLFNPFTADVANKRCLGSAPMSPFGDDRVDWSDCLVW